MSQTTGNAAQTDPAVEPIARSLGRLRSRARALLTGRELVRLLAGLLAFVLVFGLIDYLLRLPPAIRWINLVLALAMCAWFIARRVRPASRFAPRLVDLAVRLERSGIVPGATGLMASGLELGSSEHSSGVERALARSVASEAGEKFAAVRATQLASPRRLNQALGALCLVVLAAAAPVLTAPALASIGATRTLAPWADSAWPKRTAVRDDTGLRVHPIGSALPLRATLTKTNRAEGRTRVVVAVRINDRDVRRVPMTAQPRSVAGQTADGERFERLIDPGVTARDGSATMEYWFETDDDRTPTQRVLLVARPEVRSAVATVTPPDYATRIGADAAFVSGERNMLELDRPLLGPLLAGSRIGVDVQLSKPVPEPLEAEAVAAALGLDSVPDDLVFSAEGTQWSVSWVIADSTTLRLSPVDEHGVTSLEPTVLAFDAAPDLPPTITVADPARDEAVLPTAVVEVLAEARDDVGLSSVVLTQQLATPPEGSPGATPEPTGEVTEIASADSDGSTLTLTAEYTLELESLGVSPGDEVTLTALAADIYELDGVAREPVASTPRVLRIIAAPQLVEQIRAELSGVRRSVVTLDGDQAQLADRVEAGVVGPELERQQEALSRQIGAQQELVERLVERTQRNRLDDETLGDLLQRVEGGLERAGEAAQRAAADLAEAGEQEDEAQRREEREQARTEQGRVRDELGAVGELLDRGEDGWLARRGLERLLEEQQRLAEQTEQLARQTVGKSQGELTEAQQQEQARIAERQQELSERAEEVIEELSERARQLRDSDEAQASALAQAAERGRQEQVSEQMSQAGESAQQNQMASAQQQQQEAIEALEQMEQDLDRGEQNRDERLRRVLADLMQQIDGLIAEQTAQLAALNGLIEAGAALDGLDTPMIRLHGNTIAVADQARAEAAELRTVAGLIERAGDAQTEAIVALRADTPDADGARDGETRSLELLNEAKEEAEKLDEEADQREQDRVRRELEKAYNEALAEQTAIRDETEPFVDRRLNRRERQDVRGLGERQMALRAALGELLDQTDGLADVGVFVFAHERLDRLTLNAGEALGAGEPTARAKRNQDRAVRLLAELVEALKNEPPDKDFREEQQEQESGQGGEGQAEEPLVPDLGQLRLLKAMQTEAYERTRDAGELDGEDLAIEREELGSFQRSLAEEANAMLEKLAGGSGAQPAPAPTEPGAESPDGEGEESE